MNLLSLSCRLHVSTVNVITKYELGPSFLFDITIIFLLLKLTVCL